MDSIDPKIPSVSLQNQIGKNKKLPLPIEVIHLPANPEIESFPSSTEGDPGDNVASANGDDDCTERLAFLT